MAGEWIEELLGCFIEYYQTNFPEDFQSDLEYLEEKYKMMNDEVHNPNSQNTSLSEISETYEPSPRMDSYEQPSCLGSTFVSEALRKSDQLHQTFKKSSIAMTHKLDDMIELLKSQPKRTYNKDLECEIVMVKMPKYMAWLDDEPIGIHTARDSPKEVEETIGIPIEVEPLDHMKLEDLGLNINTHDLFLSSNGFPSVDESEPQLLPNFSPLDVNLGDKRGTDPPINPYCPGSFRMKVVKPLTIHTPPSSHVAYLYRNHLFIVLVVGEENLFIEAEIEELDDVTMNENVEANVIPRTYFKKEEGCEIVKVRDIRAGAYRTLYTEEGKETVIQEKDKVVDYKVVRNPEDGSVECDSRKIHFEALEKGFNTTCIEKKHGDKDEAIEKLTNEAIYVVDECLFLLRKDEEQLKQFVEKLENIKKEIQVKLPNPSSQKTGDVIEDIYAIKKPNQNLVNNPQKASNKGGQRGERRKSGREIAMKAKAKRARKCGYCVEIKNKHTKTTCPLNQKYIAKLARIEAAAEQERRIAASATEQEDKNSDTAHIVDKEQSNTTS
ncbi:hypothetical protein Tco_0654162 [Tanacetum coccineum]|uniref:Uncharacterized protein n=1 Tax=Tanacetum coccineum TaxID=301880 RepID=A0ABQ4X2X2_9ASTR